MSNPGQNDIIEGKQADFENMESPYQIDKGRIIEAANLLKKKILIQPSQTESVVRFDRGFFKETEAYKYDVYNKCRVILDFEHWTTDMFETTDITDRMLRAFKRGGNLINYYTDDFRRRIDEDPIKAQKIVYNLFKGADDYTAFCDFTDCFGNQYSKTTFLFFLKDKERYLPIKPELFRKWLSLLGISNQCTYGLTWNHYMEFVHIIETVRDIIEPLFEGTVSLLDAHSFVWCMYLLEEDFEQADSDYVDYSDGEYHVTKEQWENVLKNGVLKSRYIDTLYKFYLSPKHTATCVELGAMERVNSSTYITPVVEMSKSVAEYLGLSPRQRSNGMVRWWPVLFLGRRLLDGHFEWRVRPELVEALKETSEKQIEKCQYCFEERQSEFLDNDELFTKASEASSNGRKVYYTETVRIQRNPYVSEWAKRRENGICLLCGDEGPFQDERRGRAFLEVHHIIPLAEGGSDSIYNVVALCPNCHRKMHHPNNGHYKDDLQFLKECIEEFKSRDAD